MNTKPTHIALLTVFLGFVTGLFLRWNDEGGTIPGWIIAILLVSAAACSIWYWRVLDETAREAHKFSWYWGSTFGLLALIGLCALSLLGIDFPAILLNAENASQDPRTAMIAGIYTVLIVQIIGYFCVWTVWWLRMR